MKDGDENLSFSLTLVSALDSVLLLPAKGARVSRGLTKNQAAVLLSIHATDPGNGVSAVTIIKDSKVPESSAYRVLGNLGKLGLVRPRGNRFSLTEAGTAEAVSLSHASLT